MQAEKDDIIESIENKIANCNLNNNHGIKICIKEKGFNYLLICPRCLLLNPIYDGCSIITSRCGTIFCAECGEKWPVFDNYDEFYMQFKKEHLDLKN